MVRLDILFESGARETIVFEPNIDDEKDIDFAEYLNPYDGKLMEFDLLSNTVFFLDFRKTALVKATLITELEFYRLKDKLHSGGVTY